MSWHLHTIQKSGLLEAMESHFSLVCVMKNGIIYLHVWEKANFLLITLIWQTYFTFNVCMKTVDKLNMFLTGFILCLIRALAVSHCSIKMFHLQQSYGILNSLRCNYSCRTNHELWQGVISIHLIMIRKKYPSFQATAAYRKQKSTSRKIMLTILTISPILSVSEWTSLTSFG